MALDLKINITQADNGAFITLYDTTGAYDAGTNPGGYGAPNPATTDLNAATLQLYKMNEDGSYTSVYGPTSVYTAGVFPTDDTTYGLDITLDLEDGYYKAIYTVTDGAVSPEENYSVTDYFTFYADARCCFKQKALKVENCKCGCSEVKLSLIEMHIAIEAIETAAADDNAVNVYNAIAYANRLCGCDCGC